MKPQRQKELQVAIIALSFVLISGMIACGTIKLIAPYDQKLDDGITVLQKTTAEFFTKIERQGGSTAEDYCTHTGFYDEARVALSGLLVRAGAVASNNLTVKQLEILRQQLQKLEEDHRNIGIPQPAIPQLEAAFNRTFTAIITLEIAKKRT